MDNQVIDTDEISIKVFLSQIKKLIIFIKGKWLIIFINAIIFGVLGFLYVKMYSIKTYQANMSFVLEESKSGVGGLASLAGQFGVDIGSTGQGGGLFYGENLLIFLKSPTLARTVLLTPYDSTSQTSLADRYADIYGYNKAWQKSKTIGKAVNFFNLKGPDRLKDSLLNIITQIVVKKELFVDRPEKKASYVTVSASMRDEMLAKLFCERIVAKAVEIYIQSKTKRLKTNLDRLQNRADSIGAVLNGITYTNAAQQEQILDINPGSRTSTVKAELSGRDKIMLITIYGEVVKNLEIAKVQLNQESPTIQIIDSPFLPLKINKASSLFFFIIAALCGAFITIIYLTIKHILKS